MTFYFIICTQNQNENIYWFLVLVRRPQSFCVALKIVANTMNTSCKFFDVHKRKIVEASVVDLKMKLMLQHLMVLSLMGTLKHTDCVETKLSLQREKAPLRQGRCCGIWRSILGLCEKPEAPTNSPAKVPTKMPTKDSTKTPSKPPSKAPTKMPTRAPTKTPSKPPTKAPTKMPTKAPTKLGTVDCNGACATEATCLNACSDFCALGHPTSCFKFGSIDCKKTCTSTCVAECNAIQCVDANPGMVC
jgi:hypothetical protein